MRNPKGCWRMCCGAFLVLFCVLGLLMTGFSVYLPLLSEHFSLSNTQTSLFVTVRNLVTLACMFCMGKYHDLLGLRLGMTVTVLLGTASMFVFSVSGGVVGLCIASALAGAAMGLLGIMYAPALLIRRWFRVHLGAALGIVSASSGIASVLGAPVVAKLVRSTSLKTALRLEALFFLVVAIMVWVLIRNSPDEQQTPIPEEPVRRRPLRITSAMLVMAIIGAMGGPGYQFLSMHYATSGLSAAWVAVLVSLMGGALTVSKFVFGKAVDRWGAFRINRFFFGCAALGCILSCVSSGYGASALTAVIYGFGLSMGTVGLSVFARDLSKPEDYAATLRGYQISNQTGVVLFGLLPGVLADRFGSYNLFYMVLLILCVFAFFVLQYNYRKKQTEFASGKGNGLREKS